MKSKPKIEFSGIANNRVYSMFGQTHSKHLLSNTCIAMKIIPLYVISFSLLCVVVCRGSCVFLSQAHKHFYRWHRSDSNLHLNIILVMSLSATDDLYAISCPRYARQHLLLLGICMLGKFCRLKWATENEPEHSNQQRKCAHFGYFFLSVSPFVYSEVNLFVFFFWRTNKGTQKRTRDRNKIMY